MRLKEYINYIAGDSFLVDEALVVGPYPSRDFFELLQNVDADQTGVTPRSKLTVLTDDGWDIRQVAAIRELYSQPDEGPDISTFRVKADSACGLVHAKIYFFTLRNHAGTYTKRILLVGSANASTQGFGIHAETYVSVDLADISPEERRKLVDYLGCLERGTSVSESWFYLGRNSWVMLPAIGIVQDGDDSGFDSWLRRGRLCHQYRVDPRFGQLSLRLNRPLPRGEVERSLNASGFGEAQDTQLFNRAYIKHPGVSEDGTRSVWRMRYFTETYYGHWASAECFGELEEEFVASLAEEREHVIRKIKKSSPSDRDGWLSDFETAMRRVADSIRLRNGDGEELNLAEFFHMRNGQIDISRYQERALDKLRHDMSMANDSGFAKRYISGFTFPRMPQLGDDFDAFAVDFCQSLVVKLSARKVNSRLAQALRETIRDELGMDVPQDPHDLLDVLRTSWSRIGPYLMDYYKGSGGDEQHLFGT
jgi:hypothetical protein